MYSSSRDNWERLVSAVVRREQIWQMFHDHSRNPSTIESESDDEDFTSLLRFSSNRAISVTNPSTSKVGKYGIGSLTRKLFAALYPNQKPNHQDYVDVLGNEHAGVTRFSLHELLIATDNFSNNNILEDSYSWLYKLYLGQLANGCVVAVKRIVEGDSRGTFQAEVEAMSIVVHPNVLGLLGICSTRREKLLILPLMVNGTVESWLRDRLDSRAPLDWAVRQRIAVGVAKGLAYLHGECERKIIHCDVKAANIYLNEDFEAVIGNFCIATFMDHSVTHVTAVVRGTISYIAPEYLQSGTCSEQTDVFSYGIFLLELITGQRAFDLARLANDEDMMLLDWVMSAVKEVQWERFVDPEVGSNYIEEGVEQLTKIALVCTDTNPERRPRMLDIVRMLQFGDGLHKMWEEWCTSSPIQPEMIQLTLSPRESVQLSSPR